MKSKRRISIILSSLAVVFTLAVAGSAQKTGGYKKIATSDEGARAAADFAVENRSASTNVSISLVGVEHAESQVVAGVNYRLCLKVTSANALNEADATVNVRVVVYQNLKHEYKLTSWVEEKCEDEDDGK